MAMTISKYQEALNLLTQETTSIEKFNSIKTILSGQNKKLDELLENCQNALGKIEHIATGDVISLAADSIPEETEEEKKRKKAIILFIKYFRELKSELERVKGELTKNQANQTEAISILAKAKGPAGIVTALALVAALGLIAYGNFKSKPTTQPSQTLQTQVTASPRQTIEIIKFNGKQLPLTQLRVGTGADCDSPHYHAKNEVSATATDGTQIADPGGCGFGRLKDTPTQQIQI